jgi:hypothetical protein
MRENRIIDYNLNLEGNRKWYFPQPGPVEFHTKPISEKAFSVVIDTEIGVRYGISWPSDSLAEDEKASEIIVQHQGKNGGAISNCLFLFVATETRTEIKIAFPSKAPDLSEVEAIELTAREAN